MKKIKLIFCLFLCFIKGFPQDFFYYDYESKIYFGKEEIDISNVITFYNENDVYSRYFPYNDTKNNNYYYLAEKNNTDFYLFRLQKDKRAFEFYKSIHVERTCTVQSIDNSKVLLWVNEKNIDFYIYDLETDEVKEICIKNADSHFLYPTVFKNDIIFFENFYYFIEKNEIVKYPEKLNTL